MGVDHRVLADHAFAILNPLQLERACWEDLPVHSLVPAELSVKRHAMPLLLDLAVIDDALLGTLLSRADAWDRLNDSPFFSALLRTAAPRERVLARLSAQLVQKAPDGSRFLVRWFDPRVFRHLLWLLTPSQLQALLYPEEAWTWRHGTRWQRHDLQTGPPSTSLRLGNAQWGTVKRIGVLNRVLQHLERVELPIPQEPSLLQHIDHLLVLAYEHHGLSQEADLKLFCEHGVRYGERAFAHPALAERLRATREHGVSYVGVCADLPPDFHMLGPGMPRPD